MLKEIRGVYTPFSYAYQPGLKTFYRDEMAPPARAGFSQSPQKPRLFIERGRELGFSDVLQVEKGWKSFTKRDFYLAHTREYVDAFFAGKKPLCESNGLTWSAEFARSVRYTNASIYQAMRAAVADPATISFSPTSGFHHATPKGGQGFCTFSGQVIAALKLYRERGLVGAFIDLDGHFGNSIEDSRSFCKDLDRALPQQYHINPTGTHGEYRADLGKKLETLLSGLLEHKVHYVVLCHGADSHEWDDLGGQLSTVEWLVAANLVYGLLSLAAEAIGPVPLTLALFGGYRQDNYNAVLDLHWASVLLALQTLAGRESDFSPNVPKPLRSLHHAS